ncbi:MAG: VIT domain-containing protein, partial [Syntrophothermus sp.]
MKSRRYFYLIALFCLNFTAEIFAINDLVIKLPNSYSSAKGFIDKATLIVEPHGSYSEQSLYISYSDHGQFQRNQNVEVIHRFELPQGAVVNDLWLWIGDSVMQGKMYDTWSARKIYDSIVTTKRDPAFLSKIGNQYELRVFPLASGSYRRVKINYIVPAQWNGKSAAAILPLGFLNSNNNTVKPLEILFRSRENIWGSPVIEESPNQSFENKTDTLGFNYKYNLIPNTGQFSSLTLDYNMNMSDGAYFNSSAAGDSLLYFQALFSLGDVFKIQSDTSSRRNVIAIDLSGNFNKDFTQLLPGLKTVIGGSLKPNDRFKIAVSGAGRVNWLSSQWLPADYQTVSDEINRFGFSAFGDSVKKTKLPRLVFADKGAYNNLWYSGIQNVAIIDDLNMTYLDKGMPVTLSLFRNADVVAYYNYPLDSIANQVYAAIDSLFERGGVFYCRAAAPKSLPYRYIPDLVQRFNSHLGAELFRNLNGNIGACFPEHFNYGIDNYLFQSSDPDVKAELTDAAGNAIVISKKIRNGLLIVSGISSAQDDLQLKKIFANGFLQLNRTAKPSGFPALMDEVLEENKRSSFDKVLLISNSDRLINSSEAATAAREYLYKYSQFPVFNSVNLLSGSNPVFPAVTVNFIDYYGSGYLLKALSDRSDGQNFENHLYDWRAISTALSPYSVQPPKELTIEVTGDQKSLNIAEHVEITQGALSGNNLRSFAGSSYPVSEIEYKLTAKFPGTDLSQSRTYKFLRNE